MPSKLQQVLSCHLHMPDSNKSSLLNRSESVSQWVSEWVTDKHCQWSDSGPIKSNFFHDFLSFERMFFFVFLCIVAHHVDYERECCDITHNATDHNDSVLSLTSGNHGSKIWLNSGGHSVISDRWSPTCMFGLHSCRLYPPRKKTKPISCFLVIFYQD